MTTVLKSLADFAEMNPTVPYLVVDKVGICWGFSAVPKIMGNTWGGIGKSMIGSHTGDTTGWATAVWDKSAVKVVEYRTLIPSGRMFHESDVPELHTAKLFLSKVTNAKERCIRFTFSFAEFATLIANKTCSITGRQLEHKANSDDNSDQFSIDRLDPNIGYEQGNCVIMSGTANFAKSKIDQFLTDPTLTDAEKLKMIYKVENVLRKRIKAQAATEEKSRATEQNRSAAFGSKFQILPSSLR